MRIATVLLIASSLVRASACAQGTDAESKALFDGHRWFQLRDEQARKGGSSFYKAAVEVAFGHESKAEADLKKAISSANSGALNFEARELLIGPISGSENTRRHLRRENSCSPKNLTLLISKTCFRL